MRAGSLRDFVVFKELQTTLGESGAQKKEYVTKYSCRASCKKSAPSYDKDGVDAFEKFTGVSRSFYIRLTDKVNERQIIEFRNESYEILLIHTNYEDRSLLIQTRKINK